MERERDSLNRVVPFLRYSSPNFACNNNKTNKQNGKSK